MSGIKRLDNGDGGPYMVYDQSGNDCDSFATTEDAIEFIVCLWCEDDKPQAFTIRHLWGLTWETVATVCPIGSDKLMVVRNNGDTMTWECIHYVMQDGRHQYTSAINNGIEYKFKI